MLSLIPITPVNRPLSAVNLKFSGFSTEHWNTLEPLVKMGQTIDKPPSKLSKLDPFVYLRRLINGKSGAVAESLHVEIVKFNKLTRKVEKLTKKVEEYSKCVEDTKSCIRKRAALEDLLNPPKDSDAGRAFRAVQHSQTYGAKIDEIENNEPTDKTTQALLSNIMKMFSNLRTPSSQAWAIKALHKTRFEIPAHLGEKLRSTLASNIQVS